MTPCKFQIDATGTRCLIYSEDRREVFTETDNPGFAKAIRDYLRLGPLSKAYAMAEVNKDGQIVIGDEIEAQDW